MHAHASHQYVGPNDLKSLQHLLRACRSRHDHQRHRQDCARCSELQGMIYMLELPALYLGSYFVPFAPVEAMRSAASVAAAA